MLRAHLIEPVRPAHPGQSANVVPRLLIRRLVELDHHERIASALFSRETQRRDVETVLGENRCDARNRPPDVLRHEHYRVIRSRDFDGKPIEARAGDTVAAALLAAGIETCRTTPVSGAPRAPYCMMGVCFDCLVTIDGVGNRQACLERVKDGMAVAMQRGKRELAP